MDWFKRHFKQIIYVSFLFPIILVAFVSISHVTKWYGIGNPLSWAIYLSVAVEVAALSSLAAIVAKMGKKVYFPFILVTIIQFIGNVFFSYQYIKLDDQAFLDWVDLVSPVFSWWVEPTDLLAHKRIASFLLGGLLPVISLTFLGLLVSFEEKDWENEEPKNQPPENPIDANILMSEVSKIRLTDNELNDIENVLKNKTPIGKVGAEERPPVDNISENTPNIEFSQNNEPYIPALGDEEVKEMFLNEYENISDPDEEDNGDDFIDEEIEEYESVRKNTTDNTLGETGPVPGYKSISPIGETGSVPEYESISSIGKSGPEEPIISTINVENLNNIIDKQQKINEQIEAGQEISPELSENFVVFPITDNPLEESTEKWNTPTEEEFLEHIKPGEVLIENIDEITPTPEYPVTTPVPTEEIKKKE